MATNEIYRLENVPNTIRGGLERYKTHGIRTGDFLYAVLCGDLFRAVRQADPTSAANLVSIACYIAIHLPRESYGSVEAVERWIDQHTPHEVTP